MLRVMSYTAALAAVDKKFSAMLVAEKRDVDKAAGMICAADVLSAETVPAFDRSTVDGYAVRAADTFGCSDALPALSVLGAVTDGPLTLTNVANARIKETDRIACMTRNLRLLGLEVDEMEDGLTVHPGPIDGGVTVPGYGDHRMIMAMAVLSLIAHDGLTIDDEKAADVTFPTFFSLLERVKGGSG